MICKGQLTKADINDQVTMVNTEGLEIYRGYRHSYAPEKIVIHGCEEKYNYLGELVNRNNKELFTISEHDKVIVEIEKIPSLIIPKCKIKHSGRKFNVKFRVKSGKAIMTLLDDKSTVASMSFEKSNYEVMIDDNEIPTLIATILIGISEVNGLADRALSKV